MANTDPRTHAQPSKAPTPSEAGSAIAGTGDGDRPPWPCAIFRKSDFGSSLDFRESDLDIWECALYAPLCELFETAEAQWP
jgi:hypothetical protein